MSTHPDGKPSWSAGGTHAYDGGMRRRSSLLAVLVPAALAALGACGGGGGGGGDTTACTLGAGAGMTCVSTLMMACVGNGDTWLSP